MTNVVAPIKAHAEANPGKAALRDLESTWSYGELLEKTAAFAGALRAVGIEKGDRVLLIAPSVKAFCPAYYGIQAIGAIGITMNTMSTTAEIRYVLNDSTASLVVAWHENADAARVAAAERDLPFWTLAADGLPEGDGEPVTELADVAEDDTAVLLYTSGTTGKPKGVELTAGNLNGAVRLFTSLLEVDPNERFGTGLPLFHVFGQAVCLNSYLQNAATVSLLHPFHPNSMIEMARDHELTSIAGVPTMWNYMVHAPGDYGPDDFKHLQRASSGGASLPVEVIHAFEKRFGATILEGYGLTESTGAATTHAPDDVQKPGTTGPALPETVVEIRNPLGEVLPAGEVGEVFVKGPTIAKGYWGKPEATAADFPDGWLRTGDLGSLDEDGYLSIVDRAKDLIIRGGYNVYPREVEEVLFQHPDVVEAAVIGIPDETYGQEVAAVLALRDGATLDVDAMRAWLKEQLSAYKVPHEFKTVDTLPKGATGKILKRAIEWDDA